MFAKLKQKIQEEGGANLKNGTPKTERRWVDPPPSVHHSVGATKSDVSVPVSDVSPPEQKSHLEICLKEAESALEKVLESQSNSNVANLPMQEESDLEKLIVAYQIKLDERGKQLREEEETTAQLRGKTQQLERKVLSLTEALQQSRTRCDELQAALQQLQQDHRNQLQTHETYITSTTAALETRDDTNRQLREQLATLERRLQQQALTTDNEKVTDLLEERDALEAKLAAMQIQVAGNKASWAEKNALLETTIENLNHRYRELQEEREKDQQQHEETLREKAHILEDLQERLETSESQSTTLRQRNNQLLSETAEQLNEHRAEMARLRSQVTTLQTQLRQTQAEREAESARHQARVVSLEAATTQHLTKENDLQKRITAATDNNLQLERKLKEALDRITESTQRVREAEKRGDDKADQYDSLKHECQRLENEWQTLGNEHDTLLVRNAELSHQVERLRQENRQIKEEMDRLHNSVPSGDKLDSKVTELETQLVEKTKTIKLQQQRIADMKKTIQKELKAQDAHSDNGTVELRNTVPFPTNIPSSMPLPQNSTSQSKLPPSRGGTKNHQKFNDIPASHQPSSLANKLDDINFKYLKHVLLKFMTGREYEAQQLIRAIATLLDLSPDEELLIKETLDYKMSWFGSKPRRSSKT